MVSKQNMVTDNFVQINNILHVNHGLLRMLFVVAVVKE